MLTLLLNGKEYKNNSNGKLVIIIKFGESAELVSIINASGVSMLNENVLIAYNDKKVGSMLDIHGNKLGNYEFVLDKNAMVSSLRERNATVMLVIDRVKGLIKYGIVTKDSNGIMMYNIECEITRDKEEDIIRIITPEGDREYIAGGKLYKGSLLDSYYTKKYILDKDRGLNKGIRNALVNRNGERLGSYRCYYDLKEHARKVCRLESKEGSIYKKVFSKNVIRGIINSLV